MRLSREDAIAKFGSSFVHVNSSYDKPDGINVPGLDYIHLKGISKDVSVLVETLGLPNERVARHTDRDTYFHLPNRYTEGEILEKEKAGYFGTVHRVPLPDDIILPDQMLALGQTVIGALNQQDHLFSHAKTVEFQPLNVGHIWFIPRYADPKLNPSETLEPVYCLGERDPEDEYFIESLSRHWFVTLNTDASGQLQAKAAYEKHPLLDAVLSSEANALKYLQDRENEFSEEVENRYNASRDRRTKNLKDVAARLQM